MYNTVEYTYEDQKHHLTDDDAVDAYKKAKRLHPDALVILDDLSCGHWDVDIFETPKQKEVFYQKRLSRLLREWRNKITHR